MNNNHNRLDELSKIAVYLPLFGSYVLKNFPSARISACVSVLGIILEYATLSVMLPLSSINGKNSNNTTTLIIDLWHTIASQLGMPNEARTWLWLFLLLLGLRIAIGFAQVSLNTWVSKSIFAHLSAETLSRVIKNEPILNIYRKTIGHYIALAGDEAVRLGQVFFHCSQTLSAIISAIIGLVILYLFSPIVFKVTLVFLFFSGLTLGLSLKYVLSWNSESRVLTRETHTTFIEAFNGIRSIRSMAGEEFVSERYRKFNNRYGYILFLLDIFTHGSRSLPGLILIVLGLFVMFPTSGFFPEFSAIYFFTVTTMLIRVLAFLGTAVSSGGRVVIDFRAAFDLEEIIGSSEKHPASISTGKVISSVPGISISNLSCGYVADHPVLTGITAHMSAGRSYALMGKSGSGKSTLSDVLLGLLPPMSGNLQIGNLDYQQIDLSSLRRKVVLVEQQTRIFSDSVRENIAFGLKPTDAEVSLAIETAGLSEFIASLPNGLNTRLDYQGANLSGGQRQRIGLARALVRKPDVLILDEATSALDSHTRDVILQHLRTLFRDKILLFITHDTHITRNVDEIWHINKGGLSIEAAAPAVNS